MQFQVSTDYAIRIVYYLSKCTNCADELPTGMNIAVETGITYPFFIKVANRLKQSGIINTVKGRNGGYCLGRPADKISLYDIITVMEGEIKINKCLQDDGYCSRDAIGTCSFHSFFNDVQGELTERLSNTYMSEFR